MRTPQGTKPLTALTAALLGVSVVAVLCSTTVPWISGALGLLLAVAVAIAWRRLHPVMRAFTLGFAVLALLIAATILLVFLPVPNAVG